MAELAKRAGRTNWNRLGRNDPARECPRESDLVNRDCQIIIDVFAETVGRAGTRARFAVECPLPYMNSRVLPPFRETGEGRR